jgi:regulator of protease activity HflC (stomatin/prohibitin superfamily)
MHFQDGRIVRQGAGLSFWYFVPTATIVDVPVQSHDVPFIFNQTTQDYQDLTIQGQLTYRIADPEKAAHNLDFSVGWAGQYTAEEDPLDLLSQRLINTTQTIARSITQSMPLTEALHSQDRIVQQLLVRLRQSEPVMLLGLEILSVSILAIRPTPEIGRALEAESREQLQRRSDQAIYARRNAAVEEERRIKESELNTEIAVETKRRQIAETRMAGEIALERERAELIDIKVENERKDADSRAYALTTTLKPLEKVDYRMLMALAAKGADPRLAISMAFQELAENAGKIGQLNVTPDLLQTLLTTSPPDGHGQGHRQSR